MKGYLETLFACCHIHIYIYFLMQKLVEQAGAELCQAQKGLVGFEIKFKQN